MEIDFNNLKYNFYELLNVPINESKKKIKKKYQKLMLQYHPDKCSDLEKEIFYNISLAYEILSNSNLRIKYNTWLLNKDKLKNRNVLKKNYNNEIKDIKKHFPEENKAYSQFIKNSEEVQKNHGKIILDDLSLSKKYIDFSNKRGNLKIKQENIKDNDTFNLKFKNRKMNSNNLIKKSNEIMNYNNTNISKNYITVNQYDKLYSNETVQDESFTSLDIAFLLHPEFFLKDRKKYNKEELKSNFDQFKI